jgi:hypothetical protein
MPAFDLLQSLVQVPGRKRGAFLHTLLPGSRLQPVPSTRHPEAVNVLVGAKNPTLILGAHWDIDPGTTEGAIDNAASVALLADLALTLAATGFPSRLAVCFWDLEEPGNGALSQGAYIYGDSLRVRSARPSLAIVCDVLGIGAPVLSHRSDAFASHLLRRAAASVGLAVRTVHTPPSDDVGLGDAGIRSALLTSLPASGDRSLWQVMHSPRDRIECVDQTSFAPASALLHALVAQYAMGRPPFRQLRADWRTREDAPASIARP